MKMFVNRKIVSCYSHMNFCSNHYQSMLLIVVTIHVVLFNTAQWMPWIYHAKLFFASKKKKVMFWRTHDYVIEGWKLLDIRLYFLENFERWLKDFKHKWSLSCAILLCCKIVWLAVTLLIKPTCQEFHCKSFKVAFLVVWENSVCWCHSVCLCLIFNNIWIDWNIALKARENALYKILYSQLKWLRFMIWH